MFRRFLRDSAIYSSSAFLSRGISVILLPLYTRFLQPYEYGAFDLLMIFVTLANYIISLEISQGLARVYSDTRDDNEKRSYVSSAAWFSLTSYSMFALFALAFSNDIARLFLGSTEWGNTVGVMIIAVSTNGIFFLLQDLLRWQIQPMRYAIASITYSLISALIGIGAVVFAHVGIVGLFIGQIAGASVGFAITWSSGAALFWGWEFSLQKWKEMVKYSSPMVISAFAAYCSLSIDRLFIKNLLSLDSVGIYGVGARIASIVALLMVGFQSSYIPIIFQSHSAPETPKQMARIFRYVLVAAISVVLFLSGFSLEIVSLMTNERYFNSWQTIPILATAMILTNMCIFAPGILIARKTLIAAGISVGAVCVTVLGNIILLPLFGVLGSAVTSLISSLAVFVAYVYFNERLYSIPFAWLRILRAGMTGVIMAAILFFLQTQVGLWIFLVKVVLFIAGIALTSLMLLDYEELKQAFYEHRSWLRWLKKGIKIK